MKLQLDCVYTRLIALVPEQALRPEEETLTALDRLILRHLAGRTRPFVRLGHLSLHALQLAEPLRPVAAQGDAPLCMCRERVGSVQRSECSPLVQVNE